jgi:hypothetical protein
MMLTKAEQEAAKRVKRLKARAAKAERRIKRGKNVEEETATLNRMLTLLEVK